MRKRDWRLCDDPADMLHTLRSLRASGRKLRLFGCACARRVWELLPDDRSREGVEAAERHTDGEIDGEALSAAETRATAAHWDYRVGSGRPHEWYYATGAAAFVARPTAAEAAGAWYWAASARQMRRMADAGETTPALDSHPIMRAAWREERAAQAGLLRCVFGDPFRRPARDPSWLTSTVVALARGVHEDRAFDRLPILADALMDAGCESEAVLGHCRDERHAHVRGCWVVDLLLRKE